MKPAGESTPTYHLPVSSTPAVRAAEVSRRSRPKALQAHSHRSPQPMHAHRSHRSHGWRKGLTSMIGPTAVVVVTLCERFDGRRYLLQQPRTASGSGMPHQQ